MIKNSLWKRMVFGYVTIALFMLAMSFYLIFRLSHLNKVTDSIMKIDIPSVEDGEKLVDSLLEQVRNENKYLFMVSKEIVQVASKEIPPSDHHYEEEIKKTLDQLTESINKLTLTLQT